MKTKIVIQNIRWIPRDRIQSTVSLKLHHHTAETTVVDLGPLHTDTAKHDSIAQFRKKNTVWYIYLVVLAKTQEP